MLNIIFGIGMIVGGASGKMVLSGTDSSGALVLVGLGMVAYGIFQIGKRQADNSSGIE